VIVERWSEVLLLFVLVTSFGVLATDRLSAMIRVIAVQGVLLGLLPLTLAPGLSFPVVGLALATLAVKAVILPRSLLWAIREASVRREVAPAVGYVTAILLGCAAVGIAFAVSTRLPLPAERSALLVPVSLATLMMGLILLTTRTKALSQVLGYLVLENGVFLFGLTLADRLSLLVEMGVLLDVFVGVFIMGLVVFQINRQLDSTDSSRLSELTD
jgi:hydrogenase-4 component E